MLDSRLELTLFRADPACPNNNLDQMVERRKNFPVKRMRVKKSHWPSHGPAGDILNVSARDPWRSSHLHRIAAAPGFRPLVAKNFPDGDTYLDEDKVFGVCENLVMTYVENSADVFPEGYSLSGKAIEPYLVAEFNFKIAVEA